MTSCFEVDDHNTLYSYYKHYCDATVHMLDWADMLMLTGDRPARQLIISYVFSNLSQFLLLYFLSYYIFRVLLPMLFSYLRRPTLSNIHDI
jgi:hypothetical protein